MEKEACFYTSTQQGEVRCLLCPHTCNIHPNSWGICGVRKNKGGKLYITVYAKPVALHIDPIEKKPLYHFFPGSNSYSLATVGCNFKCKFCQNWQISQLGREEAEHFGGYAVSPEIIVKEAKEAKCKSIAYTYTEPTVFFDYAYEIAKLAKMRGLYNIFVTNGYINPEPLQKIAPYLDGANVDLKSFREEFYVKFCQGKLPPVLATIKSMKKLNIWVEVTTLLIPGHNDSEEELKDIANFIAGIDRDIPWHISRFHPDYTFTDLPPTPIDTLWKAYNIGKEQGLHYIYLGNVLEGNDTYCWNCEKLLIKRRYFYVEELNIKNGKCRFCGLKIAGVWNGR